MLEELGSVENLFSSREVAVDCVGSHDEMRWLVLSCNCMEYVARLLEVCGVERCVRD